MVTKKTPARKKPARRRAAKKTSSSAKTKASPNRARPAAKKVQAMSAKKPRRLLRAFLIFVTGGVLGTGFGVALGFFLFPYIFPPPPANEVVREDEKKALFAVGNFIHANPRDPVHFGAGAVTVYRNLLHLQSDFKVGPGPKYHVYLSPREKVRKNGDFSKTASLDLGRLRSFEGSQKYTIPEGTDLSQYKSVVIWCEQFNVLISPADLRKVTMQKEAVKPSGS